VKDETIRTEQNRIPSRSYILTLSCPHHSGLEQTRQDSNISHADLLHESVEQSSVDTQRHYSPD